MTKNARAKFHTTFTGLYFQKRGNTVSTNIRKQEDKRYTIMSGRRITFFERNRIQINLLARARRLTSRKQSADVNTGGVVGIRWGPQVCLGDFGHGVT